MRSHACRSAIALLMYSVRAVRMRWPALSGIDENATFQATVALCTSAISSGCAPISRATEPYTLGHPRLGLGLRLVRTDLRLTPQVRDDGVRHHARPQRTTGVVQVGDMVDAGRVTAGAVEIDRHDPGV